MKFFKYTVILVLLPLVARAQSPLELYSGALESFNNLNNISYTISTTIYLADTLSESANMNIWKNNDDYLLDTDGGKMLIDENLLVIIDSNAQSIHTAASTPDQVKKMMAQGVNMLTPMISYLNMKGAVSYHDEWITVEFTSEEHDAILQLSFDPSSGYLLESLAEINVSDIAGVRYEFLNKRILSKYADYNTDLKGLPIDKNEIISTSNNKTVGVGEYRNYTIQSSN